MVYIRDLLYSAQYYSILLFEKDSYAIKKTYFKGFEINSFLAVVWYYS